VAHDAAASQAAALPAYLQCDGGVVCAVSWRRSFILPLAWYLGWQVLYYLKTEVVDAPKLNADPRLATSLRWLAGDSKSAMALSVRNGLRAVGIMRPNEEFDATTLKTKLVFMGAQLVYTVAALLPTKLMWDYEAVALAFLIFWAVTAQYNGATYYMFAHPRRYPQAVAAEYARIAAAAKAAGAAPAPAPAVPSRGRPPHKRAD